MIKKKSEYGSILLALIFFMLIVPILFLLVSSMFSYRSQVNYELSKTSSFYAAHSAVINLIYEINQFESGNTEALDLSSSSVPVFEFKKRYETKPALPYFTDRFPETTITFDSTQPYYSVDNSMSDYSCKGWRDRGRNTASIPPFCIDLIITVKSRGYINHYEAIINRKWPYAVFCGGGPIVVTRTGIFGGNPLSMKPCSIKGSLYSLFDPSVYRASVQSLPQGLQSRMFQGFGNVIKDENASDYTNASLIIGSFEAGDTGNCVTGDLYTIANDPNSSTCGMVSSSPVDIDPITVYADNMHQGKKVYGKAPVGLLKSSDPISYIKLPDKDGFSVIDPENAPEFDIDIPGSGDSDSGSSKPGGSAVLSGKKKKFYEMLNKYVDIAGSNPSGLPPELQTDLKAVSNNTQGASQIFSGDKTKGIISKYLCRNVFGYTCFLKKTLTLTGTANQNRYYLRGDLINHRTVNKKKTFPKAGVVLKNCTLYVDGDFDLREFAVSESGEVEADGTIPNIRPSGNQGGHSVVSSLDGDNATLVISGNMKLIGGSIDSKDKGMVIFARNMELATKGNYRGLILSKGIIRINPYPNFSPLPGQSGVSDGMTVNGAVVCSGIYAPGEDEVDDSASSLPDSLKEIFQKAKVGGLVLRSVDLTFDPKYVKALHRFGKPRISIWQEIR